MSVNNTTIPSLTHDIEEDFVLSEESQTLMFVSLLLTSIFGVISNIINMIVFYKLKGGDPININLFGLAVSDFFVCLTSMFLVILTTWILEDYFTNFRINAIEVFYVAIGIPNTVFVRITVLLTALVSFERCLCVVVPLRVKTIISSGRVKFSVVLCFLVGIIVAIPIYAVNRLEWVNVPILNTSILRHVKTEEFYEVNYWFTPLEGVCLHIIPFLIVTVSTVVMIRSLKEKIAFRKRVARTRSNEMVYKEKKVAVMVAIMSSVFLICNIPNIVVFLTVAFDPSSLSLDKSNKHLIKLIGFFPLLLSTFNSSINIVIYYRNSSKYQMTFKKVFQCRKIN